MSVQTQLNSEYASAAWDEESIPAITLDNIPGKFRTTISNILSKHFCELKTDDNHIMISKKKLKDLITKHNNEIFSFMSHPDKTPQMIGIAETIFRRYGQDIPSIKGGTANSVLKDLHLDVSMDKAVLDFDINLKKIGESGLHDFMKQLQWVFNQYKVIGEEILRQETVLHQNLEMLDRLNNRIPLITSLITNEVLPELIDTFGKYADSVYKSCRIDEKYIDLVELYKKWNVCRQIVSTHIKNPTNDPQCSICLSESVSYAIVPCGHTFCSVCSKKQNTNCYICRGTIRERIKLYFT